MKIFSNFRVVRNYYKLAGLKSPLIGAQFFFLLVPAILSIYLPVLTANVISSLTVFDFDWATKQLWINLAIIVICAILYLIFWFFNSWANKIISINFNRFLYQNVRNNNEISSIGLQTILNVKDCIDFNRIFLFKLCFFVKSVVVLAIIFHFNHYVALTIILVSILSYGLFYIFDSRIQKLNVKISKNENDKLFLFNNIKAGKVVETDFNLSSVLEDKYFSLIETGNKFSKRVSLLKMINEHFVSLILKTSVIVLTIYLVGLVKETILTLSLYLILTPYLTNSAQNLISFLDVFSSVGHIDNILSEFSSLKPENETQLTNAIEFYTYNLCFYHISTKKQSNINLQNLDLKLNFGTFNIFVQKETETKNLIIDILKRNGEIYGGSILLDGKDITAIDFKTYQNIVAFTNTKPYFFNVSLQENLLLVCSSPSKISRALTKLSLKERLDKLPQKLHTKCEKIDDKNLFFTSIARAYIAGTKILCIDELPQNFIKSDYDLFKKIIRFLSGKMTIILFSSSDFLWKVADNVIYLENGKIKSVKSV